MDVVETLQKDKDQFRSTTVDREDNLNYDLGNLSAFDPKPIDVQEFKQNREKYLMEVARDDLQLMVNRFFKLPTERSTGLVGVFALLPERTTVIPREKPLPKAKPMTKWAKFALEKGITKKKKSRMTIDDNTGEVRPTWGFKRANSNDDEWVVEARASDDPSIDPFTKKEMDKKARVLKNQKQEKSNKMRAAKADATALTLPTPGVALTNDIRTSITDKKMHIDRALQVAQKATISMGKFDKKIEGEAPIKEKKKYEPLFADEHAKTKKAMDKVLNTTEDFDVNKAVNVAIQKHRQKRKTKGDFKDKRGSKKSKSKS